MLNKGVKEEEKEKAAHVRNIVVTNITTSCYLLITNHILL
mgnify:CR=1 FL=1